MNRDLKPRMLDPRAGFDPSHHTSHQTLGGLTRRPDLKRLMEEDRTLVMQRNAVIALANSGTEQAIEILRHHKDGHTGKLGEYLTWAMDRVTERMGRHNKPDAGDA